MSPRQDIAAARRIVIKLGTHVITHREAGLALGRLFSLVEGVARVHRHGREVVLVSSGAVGMGQRALGLTAAPTPSACARPAPRSARASVSVRELVEFGDNDGLSARVAITLGADLLVLLTDVDGLFTANPRTDPTAQRIAELTGIDDATLARAVGSSTAAPRP